MIYFFKSLGIVRTDLYPERIDTSACRPTQQNKTRTISVRPVAPWYTLDIKEAKRKRHPHHLSTTSRSMVHSRHQGGQAQASPTPSQYNQSLHGTLSTSRRPSASVTHTISVQPVAPWYTLDIKEAKRKRHPHHLSTTSRSMVHSRHQGGQAQASADRAAMEEIGPSSAPGHPCPPKKHYKLPYSLSQESLLHQKA